MRCSQYTKGAQGCITYRMACNALVMAQCNHKHCFSSMDPMTNGMVCAVERGDCARERGGCALDRDGVHGEGAAMLGRGAAVLGPRSYLQIPSMGHIQNCSSYVL